MFFLVGVSPGLFVAVLDVPKVVASANQWINILKLARRSGGSSSRSSQSAEMKSRSNFDKSPCHPAASLWPLARVLCLCVLTRLPVQLATLNPRPSELRLARPRQQPCSSVCPLRSCQSRRDAKRWRIGGRPRRCGGREPQSERGPASRSSSAEQQLPPRLPAPRTPPRCGISCISSTRDASEVRGR